MTEALDETVDGTVDFAAAEHVLGLDADVIAVGPGLGRGEGVTTFVRELLEKSEMPLVLDADALNAFADEPAALVGREGRDLIITPHPGEMARLVGLHGRRRAGRSDGHRARLRRRRTTSTSCSRAIAR